MHAIQPSYSLLARKAVPWSWVMKEHDLRQRIESWESLPRVNCPLPLCGEPMTNSLPPAGRKRPSARTYGDCLRQCLTCKVGFSNARTSPTLIHDDPAGNVPIEVRHDVIETLGKAINVLNRNNKIRKFGYSTSEDAVTWTVFSFLSKHRPDLLSQVGKNVFALQPSEEVSVLLWGVPITPSRRGTEVQETLLSVLQSKPLLEDPHSLSEPDVILDYGDAGVVIIEVKYTSPTKETVSKSDKWDRYLQCDGVFRDCVKAKDSNLYELVRNWRIARDLAGKRPYTLVNLAKAAMLENTKGMDDFTDSLQTSSNHRFLPLPWKCFLTALRKESGSLPPWLIKYLRCRKLLKGTE